MKSYINPEIRITRFYKEIVSTAEATLTPQQADSLIGGQLEDITISAEKEIKSNADFQNAIKFR